MLSLSLLWLPTAAACVCGPASFEHAFKNADVVFRGTVTAVERGRHPLLEATRSTIVVREVWKGAVGREVTLLSGALCSVESLPEDTEWVVFGYGDGETITIPYCSGTEQVGATTGPSIADLFGEVPPPPVTERLGPGRPPED